MDSLIQTIHKLQNSISVIGGEYPTDLPQIVVVGSQSSGKSSVIERLVKKSFLPIGTGFVTRAPLILRMIRYSDEDMEYMKKTLNYTTDQEEVNSWFCFLHKPDKIFTNYDKVKKEINRRTDELAGKNNGITHEPIVLKIYTSLFDLTLVDLPGIMKVPIDDQPEDIEKKIKELIMKYVEQPNSIILAIVTANTDPSTSESLKIARKVDPNGERTIAVVTKLDLIDKGTLKDTEDFLKGYIISVKLGIIGVVNRSQTDIIENESISGTIKREKEFLEINYPEIDHKHGILVLAKTLQSLSVNHIKKTLLQLHKTLQIIKSRLEIQKTLKSPDSDMSFISELLKDISKSYSDTIQSYWMNKYDKDIIECDIINKIYIPEIKNINPLIHLDKNHIEILINTDGTSNNTFINKNALKIIIGKQLEYLVKSSMVIVNIVSTEMLKVFDSIDSNLLETLKKNPKINNSIRLVLKKLLDVQVTCIKESIKIYIEIQQSCIDTRNSDFIDYMVELISGDALYWNTLQLEIPQYAYTQDEQIKKQLIVQMMDIFDLRDFKISEYDPLFVMISVYYYNFIKKNIIDFVPKCIQNKMVNFMLNELDKRLIEHVFTSRVLNKSIDEVIAEEDVIKDC